MNLYGLIGFPLSHSFSKKYFTNKFEEENIKSAQYALYPISAIDDLPVLLNEFDELKGLNVTIPYKEQIIPFLDEIEEAAKNAGAVNTVKITNGKLKGYNTDIYGFEKSLLHFIRRAREEKQLKTPPLVPAQPPILLPVNNPTAERLDMSNLKALVLGTGGAAKAVAYVLEKLGIRYKFVSRRKQKDYLTYQEISPELITDYKLIINTTPLGMMPKVDTLPDLPYANLTAEHLLFDLVYNPNVTAFLKKGKECSASIQNGLEMLHLQAEKSWEIWTAE